MLKQAVALYDFYTQQIQECDEEIERMYAETRPDWDGGELKPLPARKRNSHSKTCTELVEVTSSMKRRRSVDT